MQAKRGCNRDGDNVSPERAGEKRHSGRGGHEQRVGGMQDDRMSSATGAYRTG